MNVPPAFIGRRFNDSLAPSLSTAESDLVTALDWFTIESSTHKNSTP